LLWSPFFYFSNSLETII